MEDDLSFVSGLFGWNVDGWDPEVFQHCQPSSLLQTLEHAQVSADDLALDVDLTTPFTPLPASLRMGLSFVHGYNQPAILARCRWGSAFNEEVCPWPDFLVPPRTWADFVYILSVPEIESEPQPQDQDLPCTCRSDVDVTQIFSNPLPNVGLRAGGIKDSLYVYRLASCLPSERRNGCLFQRGGEEECRETASNYRARTWFQILVSSVVWTSALDDKFLRKRIPTFTDITAVRRDPSYLNKSLARLLGTKRHEKRAILSTAGICYKCDLLSNHFTWLGFEFPQVGT